MSDLTDAQLIARSITDPAAFARLFERHFATIHRYLRRRMGAELASELTSETFLVAFRRRADFGGPYDTALPWLYAIAGNLLRMHHRTEERRLRAYARAAGARDVAADWSLDGRIEAVDDRLDAQALAPVLAEALAGLTPALREVLLLHAWAELSHEEIAATLECSPGAVRTRLSRGREQLARRLNRLETGVIR